MIAVLWEKMNNSIKNYVNLSTTITTESRIRRSLAAHYGNVRNIDVGIDVFFKGSMLARVSHKLDIKTVEVAAKAYVLWNTPGVALNPYDSRYLHHLGQYLCKKECKTIKKAAINPEGSIQASGVPCQAFVGCLIHEIVIRGSTEDWKIIEEAQQSFCRRLKVCPGLEILNEDIRYLDQSASCPIIYPSGVEPTTASIFPREISKVSPELSKKEEESIRHL